MRAAQGPKDGLLLLLSGAIVAGAIALAWTAFA
jgi:hypothetical protein